METILYTLMLFIYALNAGFFFSFSNTVVKALKAVKSGKETMKSINQIVLNPLFFMVFGGGLLISIIGIVTLGIHRNSLIVIAALIYSVGCFGVTGMVSVPLNTLLESNKITWDAYQVSWLRWNRVRLFACLISSLVACVGLIL